MTPLAVPGFTPFCFLGGAPSPGNTTNHNHATAVTGGVVTGSGGSNFKRQNTVDAATIKENSARVAATRPSAPKNSPGQLDTSEFISHSNNTIGDPLLISAVPTKHTTLSFIEYHRFEASITMFAMELVSVN